MAQQTPGNTNEPTRLLTWLVPAGDDGLLLDSIMLCEIAEGELQTISLRLASDHARLCLDSPRSEA